MVHLYSLMLKIYDMMLKLHFLIHHPSPSTSSSKADSKRSRSALTVFFPHVSCVSWPQTCMDKYLCHCYLRAIVLIMSLFTSLSVDWQWSRWWRRWWWWWQCRPKPCWEPGWCWRYTCIDALFPCFQYYLLNWTNKLLAGAAVFTDDTIWLVIRLYIPISKSFRIARSRHQKDEVGRLISLCDQASLSLHPLSHLAHSITYLFYPLKIDSNHNGYRCS